MDLLEYDNDLSKMVENQVRLKTFIQGGGYIQLNNGEVELKTHNTHNQDGGAFNMNQGYNPALEAEYKRKYLKYRAKYNQLKRK